MKGKKQTDEVKSIKQTIIETCENGLEINSYVFRSLYLLTRDISSLNEASITAFYEILKFLLTKLQEYVNLDTPHNENLDHNSRISCSIQDLKDHFKVIFYFISKVTYQHIEQNSSSETETKSKGKSKKKDSIVEASKVLPGFKIFQRILEFYERVALNLSFLNKTQDKLSSMIYEVLEKCLIYLSSSSSTLAMRIKDTEEMVILVNCFQSLLTLSTQDTQDYVIASKLQDLINQDTSEKLIVLLLQVLDDIYKRSNQGSSQEPSKNDEHEKELVESCSDQTDFSLKFILRVLEYIEANSTSMTNVVLKGYCIFIEKLSEISPYFFFTAAVSEYVKDLFILESYSLRNTTLKAIKTVLLNSIQDSSEDDNKKKLVSEYWDIIKERLYDVNTFVRASSILSIKEIITATRTIELPESQTQEQNQEVPRLVTLIDKQYLLITKLITDEISSETYLTRSLSIKCLSEILIQNKYNSSLSLSYYENKLKLLSTEAEDDSASLVDSSSSDERQYLEDCVTFIKIMKNNVEISKCYLYCDNITEVLLNIDYLYLNIRYKLVENIFSFALILLSLVNKDIEKKVMSKISQTFRNIFFSMEDEEGKAIELKLVIEKLICFNGLMNIEQTHCFQDILIHLISEEMIEGKDSFQEMIFMIYKQISTNFSQDKDILQLLNLLFHEDILFKVLSNRSLKAKKKVKNDTIINELRHIVTELDNSKSKEFKSLYYEIMNKMFMYIEDNNPNESGYEIIFGAKIVKEICSDISAQGLSIEEYSEINSISLELLSNLVSIKDFISITTMLITRLYKLDRFLETLFVISTVCIILRNKFNKLASRLKAISQNYQPAAVEEEDAPRDTVEEIDLMCEENFKLFFESVPIEAVVSFVRQNIEHELTLVKNHEKESLIFVESVKCLSTIMLCSEEICDYNIGIYFKILLCKTTYSDLKSYLFLSLYDMIVEYPNLLQPLIDKVYSLLHLSLPKDTFSNDATEDDEVENTSTESMAIEVQCFDVLNSLILKNRIKLKNNIDFLLLCLCSLNESLVDRVKNLLYILNNKNNHFIFNIYIESVYSICKSNRTLSDLEVILSFLNNILFAMIKKDTSSKSTEKQVISIIHKLLLKVNYLNKDENDIEAQCEKLFTVIFSLIRNQEDLIKVFIENVKEYESILTIDDNYQLLKKQTIEWFNLNTVSIQTKKSLKEYKKNIKSIHLSSKSHSKSKADLQEVKKIEQAIDDTNKENLVVN